MEKLDLSTCTTNAEVTALIKERVKSIDVKELISALSDRFIYQDDAITHVYTALATGHNAILHGPGGFGKSVLVKAICEYYGIPLICKIGYEDMSVEELMGLPNMQALLQESRYETAFENSVFVQPGILLLEEFLDVSPRTAAALKDILTEKGFREGSTKKESLISNVIICGNKDPETLSTSETTKAFYKERFPVRYNVVWQDFDERNYFNFLKLKFKDKYLEHPQKINLLLSVAGLASRTKTLVSPRIATAAAEIVLELGIYAVKTIKDIDSSMLEEVLQKAKQDAVFLKEDAVLSELENYTSTITRDLLAEQDTTKLLHERSKLVLIKENLESEQYSDPSYRRVVHISNAIENCMGIIEGKLTAISNINVINDEVLSIFNRAGPS